MATNGIYGIAAGTDYFLAFSAPSALYDSLVTELGLNKLSSADELSKAIIVEAAKFLSRVSCSYEAAGGKKRTGYLWASPKKSREELQTALGGKNYRTFPIKKVGQPLDASRH